MAVVMNPWAAWLFVALIFFLAFVWLTEAYLKAFGMQLLVWLAPTILAFTNALKFITWPLGRVLDSFIAAEPVALTRAELSRMLDAVSSDDTDLSHEDLKILRRTLQFASLTVHDVMVPKSKIITIGVAETLSPIIIDELFKSGHERFPVLGEDGKTVIGILTMHDLMDIKRSPSVAKTMQEKIYYVDEDRDLHHVLDTFYKTKQSVFIVHNQTSDMVGLVSIEDVVQQILGKPGKQTKPEIIAPTGEVPLPVVE